MTTDSKRPRSCQDEMLNISHESLQIEDSINEAVRICAANGPGSSEQVYLEFPPVDRGALLYAPVDGPVRLSSYGISKNMTIDNDNSTVESFSGYRSVRATHGAYTGSHMFEVKIECDVGEGIGVRLGWSTKKSDLEEPVGANADGYGFCVLSSQMIHNRKKFPIQKDSGSSIDNQGIRIKRGDVIGCFLHLGSQGRPFEPTTKDFVRYKGRIHVRLNVEENALPVAKAIDVSFMEIFVNGVSIGRAFFGEIMEGTYYPTVSLFTKSIDQSLVAKVRVNFGSAENVKEGWLSEYTEIYFDTIVRPAAMLSHADTKEDSI